MTLGFKFDSLLLEDLERDGEEEVDFGGVGVGVGVGVEWGLYIQEHQDLIHRNLDYIQDH